MSITSVRDNENNRWKRTKKPKNTKKKQRKTKEQGGTEVIVKGRELNDFVVHLN